MYHLDLNPEHRPQLTLLRYPILADAASTFICRSYVQAASLQSRGRWDVPKSSVHHARRPGSSVKFPTYHLALWSVAPGVAAISNT